MKFTNLEKLLPFGYIILVVLGIIKESVIYFQLGINIMNYSNIMDVLISPIADLTNHPAIVFILLVYCFFGYLWYSYLLKNPEKEISKKWLGIQNLESIPTTEALKIKAGNKFLGFLVIANVFFFLGIGLSKGSTISKKIETKKLSYKHIITLNNQEKKQIFLINTNSSNVFYIEKGKTNIEISPISAITSIEFLKNKKKN